MSLATGVNLARVGKEIPLIWMVRIRPLSKLSGYTVTTELKKGVSSGFGSITQAEKPSPAPRSAGDPYRPAC